MATFVANKKARISLDVKKFDDIRQIVEDTLIENLRQYYEDQVIDEKQELDHKKETERRLKLDLARRNFCEKDIPSRLFRLIPLIADEFSLCISSSCVVFLFLYYGLVLCESTDDTIWGMLYTLRILVGDQRATKLYNKIVHIASATDSVCSQVRRTLLFFVHPLDEVLRICEST